MSETETSLKTPYLVDTHCHIHDVDTYNFALSRAQFSKKFLAKNPDFPHEKADFTPEKILTRAKNDNIKKIICVGTSHADSLATRAFAEAHKNVFWSYGIHPDEAETLKAHSGDFDAPASSEPTASRAVGVGCPHPSAPWREQETEGVFGVSASNAPVAIGEVGLDYRHDTHSRPAQIALFEQMLDLAKRHNLPLIFHIRDAFDDFFAVLNNFPDAIGVVHSFSDSQENLEKSLSRGFYIGVNGLATFAPEIPVENVPLEKLLLETDAPFLTPRPFRGTINEPARINDICAHISKIKGESEAKIAEITTKNATELFKI